MMKYTRELTYNQKNKIRGIISKQLLFRNLLILLALSFLNPAFAQHQDQVKGKVANPPSPVIIGSLVGNNGLHIETIFSKTFTPTSRFGVFGIADLYGVYDAPKQPMQNQQMAQTQITYRVAKGLNVSAGAFFEKHSGFRPTVGMQYNLFTGDFHFLVAPRMDLSQTYNGEILAFVEYTPLIKNDWRLYSRVQGLYNRDLKNGIHAISYTWGRLGVSYKTSRFGLGADFNSYGPMKMKENNYGLFASVLLF